MSFTQIVTARPFSAQQRRAPTPQCLPLNRDCQDSRASTQVPDAFSATPYSDRSSSTPRPRLASRNPGVLNPSCWEARLGSPCSPAVGSRARPATASVDGRKAAEGSHGWRIQSTARHPGDVSPRFGRPGTAPAEGSARPNVQSLRCSHELSASKTIGGTAPQETLHCQSFIERYEVLNLRPDADGVHFAEAPEIVALRRGIWKPEVWLQKRKKAISAYSRTELRLLQQLVQYTTDLALDRMNYLVPYELGAPKVYQDLGYPISLQQTVCIQPTARWFCKSMYGQTWRPDSGTGKEPPKAIVSGECGLDLASRLAEAYPTHPLILIVEVNEFDAAGGFSRRCGSFTPDDVLMRTDFERFLQIMEKEPPELRCPGLDKDGPVRDFLMAEEHPNVVYCPQVTVFRGPLQEGYPFFKEPRRVSVILSSLSDHRPYVQKVKYRSKGSAEWYDKPKQSDCLLDRFELLGRVVSNLPTGPDGELPIIVMTMPGTGLSVSQPFDAVALAIRHWRNTYGRFMHDFRICCRGKRCPHDWLASLVNDAVNQPEKPYVHGMVEKLKSRKANPLERARARVRAKFGNEEVAPNAVVSDGSEDDVPTEEFARLRENTRRRINSIIVNDRVVERDRPMSSEEMLEYLRLRCLAATSEKEKQQQKIQVSRPSLKPQESLEVEDEGPVSFTSRRWSLRPSIVSAPAVPPLSSDKKEEQEILVSATSARGSVSFGPQDLQIIQSDSTESEDELTEEVDELKENSGAEAKSDAPLSRRSSAPQLRNLPQQRSRPVLSKHGTFHHAKRKRGSISERVAQEEAYQQGLYQNWEQRMERKVKELRALANKMLVAKAATAKQDQAEEWAVMKSFVLRRSTLSSTLGRGEDFNLKVGFTLADHETESKVKRRESVSEALAKVSLGKDARVSVEGAFNVTFVSEEILDTRAKLRARLLSEKHQSSDDEACTVKSIRYANDFKTAKQLSEQVFGENLQLETSPRALNDVSQVPASETNLPQPSLGATIDNQKALIKSPTQKKDVASFESQFRRRAMRDPMLVYRDHRTRETPLVTKDLRSFDKAAEELESSIRGLALEVQSQMRACYTR